MSVRHFRDVLLVYLGCLIIPGACVAADESPPSGGPVRNSVVQEMQALTEPGPIDFQEAASQLASVYPLQLIEHSKVIQNSYNWQGPEDASLKCDIGFAPGAVVIKGEVQDDLPFFQTLVHPSMPLWWRITYGADGVEFILDDPTSASQHVQFALNLSSQGVEPRVELLASPLNRKPGFIRSASLRLFAHNPDAPAIPDAAWHGGPVYFQAAIPFSALAEPKFFNGPLRISVRLHDLDGDISSYLMMQETIEKRL